MWFWSLDASRTAWWPNSHNPGYFKRERNRKGSPPVCLISLETTQWGNCQWRHLIFIKSLYLSVGQCFMILWAYDLWAFLVEHCWIMYVLWKFDQRSAFYYGFFFVMFLFITIGSFDWHHTKLDFTIQSSNIHSFDEWSWVHLCWRNCF